MTRATPVPELADTASLADILIAATAELSGLTVLHVGNDFELIADISHQPLERLAVAAS
jgi:predicted nucleic acid-binding protein